jgi:hypothetical protein
MPPSKKTPGTAGSSISSDEVLILGEVEEYLRKNDLNFFFESIIESCLMATPENPALHIIKFLVQSCPTNIPPAIAAAVSSYEIFVRGKKRDGSSPIHEASQESLFPTKMTNGSSFDNVSKSSSMSAVSQADSEDEESLVTERHVIDGLVLKYMSTADEGGYFVELGGWEGPSRNDAASVPAGNLPDIDIYGGTVRSRAKLAVQKLSEIATVWCYPTLPPRCSLGC